MKNIKYLFTACIGGMLLFVGTALLPAAQDMPRMPPPAFGPASGPDIAPPERARPGPLAHFQVHAQELGLTDDQKANIRDILDANRDAAQQARQNIFQAESDLDVHSPQTFEALGTAHAAAAYHAAQVLEEVKSILTPEQLIKLEEMKPIRDKDRNGFPPPPRGKVGF